MGFFSNIISGAVKTVLTPVAVIKDAVDIVSGEEPTTTKNLIQSVVEDVSDAGEDLFDGDF
jgi:hypothetical protein